MLVLLANGYVTCSYRGTAVRVPVGHSDGFLIRQESWQHPRCLLMDFWRQDVGLCCKVLLWTLKTPLLPHSGPFAIGIIIPVLYFHYTGLVKGHVSQCHAGTAEGVSITYWCTASRQKKKNQWLKTLIYYCSWFCGLFGQSFCSLLGSSKWLHSAGKLALGWAQWEPWMLGPLSPCGLRIFLEAD